MKFRPSDSHEDDHFRAGFLLGVFVTSLAAAVSMFALGSVHVGGG